MRKYLVLFLICLSYTGNAGEIQWRPFSSEVFQQAEQEDKYVLLNLEANWCHWCHVMHDSTYSNPKVQNYLSEHYITVSADQDAYPELANRYREYGWPATIVLNAAGEDIVKRAGYISPDAFLRLLKAIVADPSPELEETSLALLHTGKPAAGLEKELLTNFRSSLDYDRGGFDQSQKFVEYASFEFALENTNDPDLSQWVQRSMDGARQLSDPVWGGIYQYSTHGDWKHLHFEKLLSIQARYTTMFLQDYMVNGNPLSLDAATSTIAYADRFLLQPNGLYANAQDADLIKGEHAEAYFALNDADRLKRGVPAVDTNTFTDNNAAMASALLRYYQVTGDTLKWIRAQQITTVLLQRRQASGTFAHSSKSREVASLKDQIAMMELLVLWLKVDPKNASYRQAMQELCENVRDRFLLPNGAAQSFDGSIGIRPEPVLQENVSLARVWNWYGTFFYQEEWVQKAQLICDFLSSEKVAAEYYSLPGLLLLTHELENEPWEYVYVQTGSSTDFSRSLPVILPFFSTVKVGPFTDFSAEKQELLEAFQTDAMLACRKNYCSAPMYTTEDVRNHLKSQR